MRRLIVAMLLAGLSAAAAAADDAVEVKGLRHPVDKSYRRMVSGMDLFQQRHDLAPQATLRYKLLPRKRDTDMDSIELRVVADTFELPVALAPDQTFTLARDPKALKEDASVRPNRQADSMTWRAEIRTPGLPPDTRRLGDLRLECLVGMQAGLVSQYPSFFGRVMSVLEDPREFCRSADVPYLFFSERPLFAVTMTDGAHREVLSVGQLYAGIAHGRASAKVLSHCDCEALLDHAYYLPLGDRNWSNETRIDFQYMDAPSPAIGNAAPQDDFTDAVLVGKSRKADVAATMGEGKAIRFDSGYEVWTYEFGPQKRRLGKTEFVVLFDPAGVVANKRIRPAP